MPRRTAVASGAPAPARDSGGPEWVVVALAPLAVAIGLLAESASYDLVDARHWVPDALVGFALIGVGSHLLTRRRAPGALLALAGGAWFLGNVWPDAVFLHRALLFHLVVAFPGWVPRNGWRLAAVAGAYALALLPALWALNAVAVASVLVMLIAVWTRRDPFRPVAVLAAGALAAGVVSAVVVRQLPGPVSEGRVPWWLYAASVTALVVVVAVGMPPQPAPVANQVVELSEGASGTLRDALAYTLEDPTIILGYWDGRHYVGEDGRPLQLPRAGDLTATYVADGDQPFAVLVHDASVLGDPALAAAVTSIIRLTGANASLQGTIREQLYELRASRRRLVTAADEERRNLAERIGSGPRRHLDVIADLLRPAAGFGSAPPSVVRALTALEGTEYELNQLAGGLYPSELPDGLERALVRLAASGPLAVEVRVRGAAPPLQVAAAVYFLCAEALANAIKHAGAESVSVTAALGPQGMTAEVFDDGRGGADPARGTGLAGVVGRVEALGGTVRITSPLGAGTRLSVWLPCEGGRR